jgi:hypothetical protein
MLHQPLLQTGQRPLLDPFGSTSRRHQKMKSKTNSSWLISVSSRTMRKLAHVYFFGCSLLKLHGRFLRLVTT